MTDVERFKHIVTNMTELYQKKNANYGNSFEKLFNELGVISGLVPLHNKLDRATNLVKGGHNDFESLEDTFIDLANYAIMNVIELQKIAEKESPVKETKEVKEKINKPVTSKEKVSTKKVSKKEVAEQPVSESPVLEDVSVKDLSDDEIKSKLQEALTNASTPNEFTLTDPRESRIVINNSERENVYKW